MGAGIVQLAAVGIQNYFLIHDPQITMFKVVYRRHTNFSIEPVRQNFVNKPNFNKKASCTISNNCDLIGKTILAIQLPQINQTLFDDSVNDVIKFAWVRKLGFAIIDNVEIEIGGQVIDKHFGEWLYILAELTHRWDDGFNNMIGNIPDIYNFSSHKDSFTLYIPLQFWFCKHNGIALPLVCLQYSDVIINVELSDFNKCHFISPTHYIDIEDNFVDFTPQQYIVQNISNYDKRIGIFSHFDIVKKRLFYTKITDLPFVALNIDSDSKYRREKNYPHNYTLDPNNTYRISSYDNKTFVFPRIGSTDSPNRSYTFISKMNLDISISDCYLIVDFIYIDVEERKKFVYAKHDYLIEQLQYTGSQIFDSQNYEIKFSFIHPTKFMVWIVQNYDIFYSNDVFNYTDSHLYDIYGNLLGSNIIIDQTIIFNGQERISLRNYSYFNYVQPFQHFDYDIPIGINCYSFSLFPLLIQPSGSCNMTQIDNSKIQLKCKYFKKAIFRSYCISNNVFRISNGVSGLVFDG